MAASLLRPRFWSLSGKYRTSCPVRNGYIVLLPEIPADTGETNPLLRLDGLPEMKELTTDNCVNGIGKLSLEFESSLWSLEENLKGKEESCTFTDVFEPLENMGAPLDTAWGTVKALYMVNRNVMPQKSYAGIHERARTARAKRFQSVPILEACKGIAAREEKHLTEAQKRVVNKFVLEGRLRGLSLTGEEKNHFDNITKKLGQSRSIFKIKVDASTKNFHHVITDSNVVRDFPVDLLQAMALDSTQPSRGPWKVSLQPYIYRKFMEHCPDAALRWNTWRAYVMRASTNLSKELNNSIHLEEIRYHRRDHARLLGYDSYAQMSMETKMAGSVENVQSMIASLLLKARAAQEVEMASLQEFALSRHFEGVVELCDVPYWRRKQQRSLVTEDEEDLREYFPFPRVFEGALSLCEDLFGINIVNATSEVKTWHEDVQYYRILDTDGSTVAGFYIDPYVRTEDKLYTQDIAGWMIGMRGKSFALGLHPLASLVFNFPQPLYGKPSLLSTKEASLLFQKIGHMLQHLLSKVPYSEVSGLTNIEWDAVEVCSNFMVNWLYNRVTLQKISGHYETGEPLPDNVLDALIHSRHHMAGYDLCQELYLSALDLELHSTKEYWMEVVRRLWPQYYAFPLDKKDCHPCSFMDISSGEWGAAYYSHVWARMVAADAFSAFYEAGVENKEEVRQIGQRFRDTFLSLGGGCHPSEVFRRFRGRDPSPNALLRSLGLKKSKPLKAKAKSDSAHE